MFGAPVLTAAQMFAQLVAANPPPSQGDGGASRGGSTIPDSYRPRNWHVFLVCGPYSVAMHGGKAFDILACDAADMDVQHERIQVDAASNKNQTLAIHAAQSKQAFDMLTVMIGITPAGPDRDLLLRDMMSIALAAAATAKAPQPPPPPTASSFFQTPQGGGDSSSIQSSSSQSGSSSIQSSSSQSGSSQSGSSQSAVAAPAGGIGGASAARRLQAPAGAPPKKKKT
jgi:hypothetical protein